MFDRCLKAKLQQLRPTVKQCDGADGVEYPVRSTQPPLSSQLTRFFFSFSSAEEEEVELREGLKLFDKLPSTFYFVK